MRREDLIQKLRSAKILVLYGGWSREREVSLRSGRLVYESLLRQGFNAHLLDMGNDFVERIKEIKPDVVVIMLHGKPGEDGTVQGVLELLGIPYTGSGVLASSIGMDKLISKRIFAALSLPTPPYVPVLKEVPLNIALDKVKKILGMPVIVKPRSEGSSLGVKIVRSEDKLLEVMESTRREFGDFFVEKYIDGKAVTVGILGTGESAFALPVLELRVKGREFYDYNAKYTKGLTEFIIPAEIPKEAERILKESSLKMHRTIGCRGFSRVDAVVSKNGEPYLLEINTIPGMTDLSDLPKEAEHIGISYDEVVIYILKSAFE